MLNKMLRYFNKEIEKFERDMERGQFTPQELFNNARMRCLGVASFCLASGEVPLVEVLRAYDDTTELMRELLNMNK